MLGIRTGIPVRLSPFTDTPKVLQCLQHQILNSEYLPLDPVHQIGMESCFFSQNFVGGHFFLYHSPDYFRATLTSVNQPDNLARCYSRLKFSNLDKQC